MTNSIWLSLLRRRTGRSRKKERDYEGSFRGTPNVNGEYLRAFRTKSYVEIYNKAQGKLGNLLEPRQEIIASMRLHRLLVDFFEASLEACRYCDTILEAIHHTRHAHAKLTAIVNNYSQKATIYEQLSSFVAQNNPLSSISPAKFRDIHDKYMVLLRRLISKKNKIRRALKIKRVLMKVGGIGLVIAQSAILVALLVLAFHSMIGLVAAPCVITSLFGLIRKRVKIRRSNERVNYTNSSRRLCEQLDVAAKGVYIMINDLDTMSRMVKRLNDDVEHWRQVAEMCVRSNGKCEILKEVVKEFRDNYEFRDMLEELEEHVCLCFLTVNRSRRMVVQEINGTH